VHALKKKKITIMKFKLERWEVRMWKVGGRDMDSVRTSMEYESWKAQEWGTEVGNKTTVGCLIVRLLRGVILPG